MKKINWDRGDTEEVFKGIAIGVAVSVIATIVDWGLTKFFGEEQNPSKGKKDEQASDV